MREKKIKRQTRIISFELYVFCVVNSSIKQMKLNTVDDIDEMNMYGNIQCREIQSDNSNGSTKVLEQNPVKTSSMLCFYQMIFTPTTNRSVHLFSANTSNSSVNPSFRMLCLCNKKRRNEQKTRSKFNIVGQCIT